MAQAKASIGTIDYAVSITAGRHALTADEPSEDGGGDTGPTPPELLCAALCACTSITLRMYAKRKGWPLGIACRRRFRAGRARNGDDAARDCRRRSRFAAARPARRHRRAHAGDAGAQARSEDHHHTHLRSARQASSKYRPLTRSSTLLPPNNTARFPLSGDVSSGDFNANFSRRLQWRTDRDPIR